MSELTIEDVRRYCERMNAKATKDIAFFKQRQQEYAHDADAVQRLKDSELAAVVRETVYWSLVQLINTGRLPE